MIDSRGAREQRPCPRPWALARPSLAYMGHARRRKSSASWGGGARAGAAATNRPRASTLGGKALEIASGGCHGPSRILEGGHEAAYLYSRSRPLGKRLPPVRHRWNCVRRSKSAGRVGGGARNGGTPSLLGHGRDGIFALAGRRNLSTSVVGMASIGWRCNAISVK